MPNDGGYLLLDADEREAILTNDPTAATYIRPFLGAAGILDGVEKWCLWLVEAEPNDLRSSPELRRRVASVAEHRQASRRAATRELANTPGLFGEIRQPQRRYLCVPLHTSEHRRYIPAVFVEPDVIAQNSTFTIEGAELYLFGLLHSAMWMTWVGAIGGRLESRYRISVEVVYNTFPWPDSPSRPRRREVVDAAQAVLAARENHPDATLADLYDPLAMPADLTAAHRGLDAATDRLYGRGRFDEVNRLAALLKRYEELSSVLARTRRRRPRRARPASSS